MNQTIKHIVITDPAAIKPKDLVSIRRISTGNILTAIAHESDLYPKKFEISGVTFPSDSYQFVTAVRAETIVVLPQQTGVYKVTTESGNTFVAMLHLNGSVGEWNRLSSRGGTPLTDLRPLEAATSIERLTGF